MAWSFFQWFYTAGKGCGFKTFPLFGLEAYKLGFYFDFSMTNVGIGMICPHMITVSIVIGTVLSWGVVVPFLNSKAGTWYDANNNLSGVGGYKVFIGVSMMLADALSTFLCITIRTLCAMYRQQRRSSQPAAAMQGGGGDAQLPPPFECGRRQVVVRSFDDRRRAQVFLRDQIPSSISIACYTLLSVLSVVVIPYLYPPLRSHQVASIFLSMPFFSGLAACGVVMGSMTNGGDLMQDLKTGYMTLTSPRAIFLSKLIGTALGCVANPVVFWVFYKAKLGSVVVDLSDVPYAKVYRGIAMLSAGQDELPMHSMHIAGLFFALALALSVLKEVARLRQWRAAAYVPSTVAIAVAFFVPPRVVIDMFVGSLVLHVWEYVDTDRALMFSSAVASGLICGDGLGSLLSSVMSITKMQAPICIKFLSRLDNVKLDAFLATLTY
jgi:uncharacterized oligopeptide transporter (OPT) family protein